jgi:hypothetical protein
LNVVFVDIFFLSLVKIRNFLLLARAENALSLGMRGPFTPI